MMCGATLRDGSPCSYRARAGCEVCGVHSRRNAQADPEDPEECAVCLDTVKPRQRKQLECGHTFHRRCVRRWFGRGSPTCPLCRAPCLNDADVAPLSSRLAHLLDLNPTPVGIHFAMHIVAVLGQREVQTNLHLGAGVLQLVVEVLYQSFSATHFLHNLRLLGL